MTAPPPGAPPAPLPSGTSAAAGPPTTETTAMPKNAKLVALLLQALGTDQLDCEPRVIPQLMDLMHRLASDVIQDAAVYSEHSGKTDIDEDDIRLAIQGRVNYSFTQPPPRDVLVDLAAERNEQPLPIIGERFGVRLPPEKFCLTQPCYQLEMADKAAEKEKS